jgi:hypothetical protein
MLCNIDHHFLNHQMDTTQHLACRRRLLSTKNGIDDGEGLSLNGLEV